MKEIFKIVALLLYVNLTLASNGRIHLSKQNLELITPHPRFDADTESSEKLKKLLKLNLVATVESPRIQGHTLQAVSFYKWKDYLFVSYNQAGDLQMGAVDSIRFKNSCDIKLVSEKVFPDSDINDLAVSDNEIFLTGAKEETGAIVYKLKHNPYGEIASSSLSSNVPSYAGTGITFSNNSIYVSTGNRGGAYRLDRTLKIREEYSNFDSRDIQVQSGNVFLLSGTENNLTQLNNNLIPQKVFNIHKDVIAESKASLRVGTYKSLLALNDKGSLLVCNQNSQEILSIPPASSEGYSTSNSADVRGKLIAVASGEAGVFLYHMTGPAFEAPLCLPSKVSMLGSINFGEHISANHVKFYGDYLLVATGLGGFKIVKVSGL